MIKPTVGRVVWFYPQKGNGPDPQGQPLAAVIAHVWGDEMVNLMVIDANGVPSSETSVSLFQGEGPRPEARFCEWMPFQIGQAKKLASE